MQGGRNRGSVQRGGGSGGADDSTTAGASGKRPSQAGKVVVRRGGGAGRQVARAPGNYGEVADSAEVHPEIRELGTEVRRVLQARAQRHATSEEQVLFGVRQFGPSKASKKILNKENEAARTAYETGLYVVWRCVDTPALRGANNDFCCRVGFAHTCFCGHPLSAHRMPTASKLKGNARVPCQAGGGCGCTNFTYVPNTPEEIGEGWLTRRANFDAAAWSPKCRCGHGSAAHDPSGRYHACNSCGCSAFTSHFLCVVCDKPWESHETVVETEAERAARGFPVREAYFPLAGIDWDVREAVLDDPTGGGALPAPPQPPSSSERPRLQEGCTLPRITGHRSSRVSELPDEGEAEGRKGGSAGGGGAARLPMDTCDYCRGCATIFKSPSSKFCSKCGMPR